MSFVLRLAIFITYLLNTTLASIHDVNFERTDNTAKIISELRAAVSGFNHWNAQLNSTSKTAPFTSSQLVAFQNYDTAVYDDLQRAIQDFQSSSAISSAEFRRISTAISALLTLWTSLVNDIIAHKPAFIASGVVGVVCQVFAGIGKELLELASLCGSKYCPGWTESFNNVTISGENAFRCSQQ